MLKKTRYCLCGVAAFFYCCTLSAQNTEAEESFHPQISVTDTATPNSSTFRVRQIFITGNRKTRNSIVLRELPFREGDHYLLEELVKKFEMARRQLINTALFHEVIVAVKNFDGYDVDVVVDVKERWYIFPVPYFKPVDRNLNQWMVEQKARLDRVNYGAKLSYNNVTGLNDKLRVTLISGYTRQFSISYDRLYIDKQLKWGMNFGFAMGKNKEVNYNTINDKQVFLKDNDFVNKYLHINAEVSYRPAIRTRHRFGINYTMEEVKDTVVALNPAYFKSGMNHIEYPEIYYNVTYYDLDYIPYPTEGYAFQFSIIKRGFSDPLNSWQFSGRGAASWHISPLWFVNSSIYGSIKIPFSQPYFNRRFLGYSDVYLQGYEYYVIDGTAGGYFRVSLNRELFKFIIHTPQHKNKQLPSIPIRIFAKVFGDAGYVYNPLPGDNSLSNTMLYSGGIGVDIVTFYDLSLKLEWTFNRLGQNGLFLHGKSIF